MDTAFAALLYRPAEVPERALTRGFAVALAGWDVPAPRLGIAPLPGLPGWSAAFYTSGVDAGEDELEHTVALFEDELSPAVAVLDAAAEIGAPGATVLTLVHAEDVLHDEAWRLSAQGFERHFVREGDAGIEAGVETPSTSDVLEVAIPEGAGVAEERAAVAPHRGSTFLSAVLGAPVLPALMGALFAVERHLTVRLVEPDAASIAAETRRLDRALGRVEGRGAAVAPPLVSGVAQPAQHAAFVAAYDWADPGDPRDVYRELSIGAVEGTLHFLRAEEIGALDGAPAWAPPRVPVCTRWRGSSGRRSAAEARARPWRSRPTASASPWCAPGAGSRPRGPRSARCSATWRWAGRAAATPRRISSGP
jgi:hypothetical protein